MHYDIQDILKKWGTLSSGALSIKYHPGQVIFYHGHKPYGVYWVKSGKILLKHSPSRECPDETPEMLLSRPEGHVFGVQEICEDIPHCCTCTAESECEVVFVSKSRITDYFNKLRKGKE